MHRFNKICSETLRHWKEISIVYVAQVFFGLAVSFVFYYEFSKHANQSMELDQLAKGFDRTVLMDMLNSTDYFLGNTRKTVFIILLIYVFVGAFLQAGWLANIRNKNYRLDSLLSNGKKFIFPFLGLAFLAFMALILIGGLALFLFTSIVGDPLVTFSSEKPYVIWIICLLILYLNWLITVWSWSIISRLFYIDGNSFFKSIQLGWSTLRKKWLKLQAIGFLILGFHVILMFLYYLMMGDHGAPGWGIVILVIIVQQFFNFLRIILRGLGYGLVEEIV